MTKNLTPAQVAELLKVSPSTVRRWSTDYERHLSAMAHPGAGRKRSYTSADLAVFTQAADLLRAGKTPEEVNTLLGVVAKVVEVPTAVEVATVPELAGELVQTHDLLRRMAGELTRLREAEIRLTDEVRQARAEAQAARALACTAEERLAEELRLAGEVRDRMTGELAQTRDVLRRMGGELTRLRETEARLAQEVGQARAETQVAHKAASAAEGRLIQEVKQAQVEAQAARAAEAWLTEEVKQAGEARVRLAGEIVAARRRSSVVRSKAQNLEARLIALEEQGRANWLMRLFKR